MTPDSEREIRERVAFDALPQEERFAILRAEFGAMTDDEWCDGAVPKPLERRAVECRADRAALLALVDAQRTELERLRAALDTARPVVEAAMLAALEDDDV